MNPPVLRLYLLVIVLFAVLVGFTSRWTVFDAEALRDNPLNRRALLQEEKIRRGQIRSQDGEVLARSVPLSGDTWGRRYPTRDLFAHAVGYSYTSIGRAGIERSHNDELTGQTDELTGILDSLLGEDDRGDALVTTLERARPARGASRRCRSPATRARSWRSTSAPAACSRWPPSRATTRTRSGTRGASPSSTATRRTRRCVNRATQNGYPPGSTMKVVTAAAALDTGRYRPDSRVSGENGKPISGVPLNNFGSEDFGDVDLTFALTNSINTVWAEVGEELGGRTMQRYMERFGFYAEPPLDYPDAQMSASGVRKRGRARAGDRRRGRRRPRRHRPGRPLRHAAPDGQRRADDRQRRRPAEAALPRPHDRPRRAHGGGGRAGGGRAGRFT